MAHISYFLFYFFGTGGGDLAEGVAEEPRRGCSINKPWKPDPNPLKWRRGP
jgi:hypothetical protein